MRKSLKSLRDPADFARCQQELQALQKQEAQGKIELYYFDEAGFALGSVVPYAWQEPNTVIELRRVKAFGEPVVDRGEQVMGFGCLALLLPETGETRCRAEFEGFGFLATGNVYGVLKTRFGGCGSRRPGLRLAL